MKQWKGNGASEISRAFTSNCDSLLSVTPGKHWKLTAICLLSLFFIAAETVAEEFDGACQALAKRLELELRRAKHAQLACGEVLLPADLLPIIAKNVLSMAENEPCGLRYIISHRLYQFYSFPFFFSASLKYLYPMDAFLSEVALYLLASKQTACVENYQKYNAILMQYLRSNYI